MEENLNQVLNDKLIEFEEKMSSLNVDKALFLENKKTVKVEKCEKFNNNDEALYQYLDNKIYVKDNIYDNLDHELLHMSSTYRGLNAIHSGLSIIYPDIGEIFGIGLNEGITALIDEKYFSQGKIDYSMLYHFPVVKRLTKFMDEDLLIKSYFKADLKTILNELVSIGGRKSSLHLIDSIDKVYLYGDNEFHYDLFRRYYRKFLFYYSYFYFIKLYQEYYKGRISALEFLESNNYLENIATRKVSLYKVINFRFVRKNEFAKIKIKAKEKALKSLTNKM